ncbi:hypothetical protein B0H66DRAFT_248638 [Apodospora peruviana]|uniref:Uncharacterized protein n=1 Tax=Apodospora peruviana TaxID=516989 RepID=A0AAE0M4T1_9PEZI|nr:hypothetical protein B0H66DRAFT_248638 [Apodospora peruviana]
MASSTTNTAAAAGSQAASAPNRQQPQQAIQIDTTDLSKDLTSPTSPSTAHSAADAQRAMDSTGAWKPRMDRRQSWSQQEYKHTLQMSKVGNDQPGSGFTERS